MQVIPCLSATSSFVMNINLTVDDEPNHTGSHKTLLKLSINYLLIGLIHYKLEIGSRSWSSLPLTSQHDNGSPTTCHQLRVSNQFIFLDIDVCHPKCQRFYSNLVIPQLKMIYFCILCQHASNFNCPVLAFEFKRMKSYLITNLCPSQ